MSRNVHAAVKVHAIDTNRWVVLDTKIDVLRDTEAEVARLAEVALPQLVFFDLEASLENFLCLWATDCDVDGDLLVTADTEGTDGESCFAWLSLSLACRPYVPSQRLSVYSVCRGVYILYTGVCPLSCSSTFAALVNLSPDSPTEILRTSFWIRSSRIGFADLSAPPCVFTFPPAPLAACCLELCPFACVHQSVSQCSDRSY